MHGAVKDREKEATIKFGTMRRKSRIDKGVMDKGTVVKIDFQDTMG